MAELYIKYRPQTCEEILGNDLAIKSLRSEIENGHHVFLLTGDSGCGKTTILRSISGLDTPTTGRVYIDGEDVTDLDPTKREVNTLFQNYSLFPLMTVHDNVEFGLKMKKVLSVMLVAILVVLKCFLV